MLRNDQAATHDLLDRAWRSWNEWSTAHSAPMTFRWTQRLRLGSNFIPAAPCCSPGGVICACKSGVVPPPEVVRNGAVDVLAKERPRTASAECQFLRVE